MEEVLLISTTTSRPINSILILSFNIFINSTILVALLVRDLYYVPATEGLLEQMFCYHSKNNIDNNFKTFRLFISSHIMLKKTECCWNFIK